MGSQLSRHRGQILGLALCVSTHGSVTCTSQEATGIFRHVRHRRRIVVRWRPRIHGCVNSAVPSRLGSCPPPLVGGVSSFQHSGRDRGQVSQAPDNGEHRNARRRRHPGIPAGHAHVPEHAYATWQPLPGWNRIRPPDPRLHARHAREIRTMWHVDRHHRKPGEGSHGTPCKGGGSPTTSHQENAPTEGWEQRPHSKPDGECATTLGQVWPSRRGQAERPVCNQSPRVRQSNSSQPPIPTAIRPAHRKAVPTPYNGWHPEQARWHWQVAFIPVPHRGSDADNLNATRQRRSSPTIDPGNVANAAAHTNAPSRRT